MDFDPPGRRDSENPARWRHLKRVQVVPITSNVSRLYFCEAALELKGEPRKAIADQVATVSKQRLKSRLATLSPDDIRAVERAIRVQLGLSPS